MGTDRTSSKADVENEAVKLAEYNSPSSLIPHPSSFARRARRRGQTAIEYLLVTASLLFVFVVLYRTLQWYLSKQFRNGGVIVMKMYKQDPN